MRRRDRIRKFISSGATPRAPTSTVALPAAQQKASPQAPPPSSSPRPAVSSSAVPSATTPHSLVLEKALIKTLETVPEAEKAAFEQASRTIDERTLLSNVQAYDVAHKNDSSFRPRAGRLSKFLNLLNRFIGGVAIGIQASPEISALVVGSVRVVIDLALKFTLYFSRLTDMLCIFEDYLGPLAEYVKAADITLVEKTVVNAYANILDFGWKARRVFVDASGSQRKWTSLRAFMRQHWETFESEFGTIREDMQHQLDVLLHSVQSLHFDFSRKTEQARQREEDRKERSSFLAWVSSIDFEKIHLDTYAKRHKNTCGWLTKEPKYEQWINSPASSLLWCNGKPGIGKSVLASTVIEDITRKIGLRDDAALCFAYYNYRNTQLQELHQVVAALIKQLCQKRAKLPRGLLQTKHDALSPSLVGTQERFLSLVEDLAQVYVVFDALDECPELERGDILGFITGIVTAKIGCQVKVFVTSRKEMDIAKAFEDKHVPTIQIQTEKVTADIETFARGQIEKLLAGENGKTLYITEDGLKERIAQTLASKAEGMFLWVNLQLDSLCQASKARNDRVVEAALNTLPHSLSETYVRILNRIQNQTPYMRDMALNCLAWTIYARRPLNTKELQRALAINWKCTTLEDLQTDSSQVILEACGNLLEEVNDSIRPIHYTVQEFFTTKIQGPLQHDIHAQLLDSTSVHTRLSLACLRYIQLAAFHEPTKDSQDLHIRLLRKPFAGYSCQNFDYHIFSCEGPPIDVIIELETLLQQESAYLAALLQIRVLNTEDDHFDLWGRFNPMSFLVTPSTVIYSTSLYNVPTVRQRWVDETLPTYAVHLAASAGLMSAVVRLLERGSNVDEKDGEDCTPLYYACLSGSLDIVELLIDNCADVNVRGGHYDTTLQAASSNGHEQIVKVLLNYKAEVNPQGGHYGTALQAASLGGHEQIVKLLLENKAEANAQGGRYGSALQAASRGGHEQIVKLLLDNKAEVNALGGEYGSALQAASRGGHEQIVKLLLDNKAEINAQGGTYSTALQAASHWGHEQIVKLLLDHEADVDALGVGGHGTALEAASENGHERVVKLLLDHKADIHGDNGGLAVLAAVWIGHKQIVKLLLDYKADVKGDKGKKALRVASRNGHEQIVKLLRDAGADEPDEDDLVSTS